MSDFPVRVDKDDATPMWIQLRDQIIDLISSGALEPEQKLPTVRDLAAQLSVSTNTVSYYVAGRNLFPKEEDGDKYAQRFLDKFSS